MKADPLDKCQDQVLRMLRLSQTRIILPVITLGLLRQHSKTGQLEFTDREIQRCYETTLIWVIQVSRT